MIKLDTLGRTWELKSLERSRGATRWLVYCESQCMMQTVNRLIATRAMPLPHHRTTTVTDYVDSPIGGRIVSES